MINLTPHSICIRRPDGTIKEIPPSGQVARVDAVSTVIGTTDDGIEIIRNEYGNITGLPFDGKQYIVSGMVIAALPKGTPNVFGPDSGNTAIRVDGKIVAVTRLVAA